MATIVQSNDELNKGNLPLKIADAVNDDEALNKGQLLNTIKAVDGAGSGLDADLLDGLEATAFASLGGSTTQTFKVADAVNGNEALSKGQFDKTVYVDEVNGDDNNSGVSSSPLKTFTSAFEKCVSGGRLTIRVLSDISVTKRVYFNNKKIYIALNGHNITFDTYDVMDANGVNVGTGYRDFIATESGAILTISSGTINLPSISSTGNGDQWFFRDRRVPIQLSGAVRGVGFYGANIANCTINIGENGYLVSGGGHGTNGYPARYTVVVKYGCTVNLDDGGSNGLTINVQEEV